MERKTANIIAEKALEAIKEAFAKDTGLRHLTVLDAGGSVGQAACTIKFSFVDSNAKPTSVLGGEVTDNIVAMGAAGSGTKIMFRGKRYTVVKAARKFYNAVDDNGKAWRVPFAGSTLAKN